LYVIGKKRKRWSSLVFDFVIFPTLIYLFLLLLEESKLHLVLSLEEGRSERQQEKIEEKQKLKNKEKNRQELNW
jgi:hypothetical protein